ncbi:MAG: DUF1028 domain-containing protein [Acetobacteraceae bacterium]|nr:DUF1028 domain-containing protein [Acetobacteraceae bacterium]
MREFNTFSIVARCKRTGHLGVAVATAVPAVGAVCPYIRSGIGAVSTQSWVNPYLAIDVLDAIAGGATAQAALDQAIAADDGRALRQIGVVDAAGRAAAWSGADCTSWFGQVVGDGFTAQGNMLTGAETIDAMVRAFTEGETADLDERLMRALEAADAAGGDKRGKQSAAIRVHGEEAYALIDARVDEHAQPVTELRRVLEIVRLQAVPFVKGMPRRDGPAGAAPPEVTAMLALSPPQRPGGGGSALPR